MVGGLLAHAAVAAAFSIACPLNLARRPLPVLRARQCSPPVAMSESSGAQLHEGIEALADSYDAFLVDQWGVMHDGKTVGCRWMMFCSQNCVCSTVHVFVYGLWSGVCVCNLSSSGAGV